jgi:hypothetical protein
MAPYGVVSGDQRQDEGMPGMETFPVVGVMALVVHDQRILMVRRAKAPDAGRWSFPAGSAGSVLMRLSRWALSGSYRSVR